MQVGIPVVPVSPAYSLLSSDHPRLKALFELCFPGLVYVSDPDPFAGALAAIRLPTLNSSPEMTVVKYPTQLPSENLCRTTDSSREPGVRFGGARHRCENPVYFRFHRCLQRRD
ncbi:MAG: hypothetical protein Ct9H300mP16_12970 [Pseudomonadota bacterium]|nr:MAG: hypothetical protein Ct9H300mP16_12970 [Pseudomonadota bacterium]